MLSIIIPTLNEERYITGILESLRVQKYQNFEIILVDGSSSDLTMNRAVSYAIKHKMNLIPINAGIANTSMQRNIGASESIGDKLIFIDADITFRTIHFLDMIVKKLDDYPAVATLVRVKPEERGILDDIVSDFLNGMMMLLNKAGIPNGRGAVIGIDRQVYDEIGGFNEDFRVAEDVDLFRKAGKHGDIGIMSKVVYESSRRYRKKGYYRVFMSWIMNGISNLIFKKNAVPDYEVIR